MIISVTERGSFRRCRRAWDYSSRSRQNLRPVVGRSALDIGRVYHQAQADWMDDFYAKDANGLNVSATKPLSLFAIARGSEEVERVKADYLANIGVPIDPNEMESTFDNQRMVYGMCVNYEERWHSPLPDGFRPVAPEQTLLVPVPGTEHECGFTLGLSECQGHIDGESVHCHYLEGTLDGLIEDEHERLFVLERKTYGSRPNELSLTMNDQFLAYLWMLGVAFPDRKIGGIAYDGAWKREQPPRGKTLEDLFLRTILTRPPEELAEFNQQLLGECLDMTDPYLSIYRNVRWEGCFDCQFVQLCNAQSRGEDPDFIKQHYYTQRSDEKSLAGAESELGLGVGNVATGVGLA